MHNMLYPADKAWSDVKVNNFNFLLLIKFFNYVVIISACAGNPPGLLTHTANATALSVLRFLKDRIK